MFWITIEQIQCFHKVVEEGSFTKAADKLHKAKSAVVYSINNLEEQIGFKLLDRDHYRPQLTQKGEFFLDKSQGLLDEMSNLQKETKLIASDVESQLKISASGIADNSQLYPVIKMAMSKFSSTEIIFEREMLSGEKMLNRDLVDLAIFENIRNKRDYDYKEISTVPLRLVIGAEHDFLTLKKSEQKKETLFNYPQIVQRSTIQDDDHNVGVHEDSLKWFVNDTPSKKELIVSGLGWGRLPSHMIEKELKSKQLIHLTKFKDDDEVTVYLCKKKNRSIGKVAKFIWDQY